MTEDDYHSEFGRGLTYCLGLFLAHAEKTPRGLSQSEIKNGALDKYANLWFNGANDHLRELQIPESLPEGLKKDLSDFVAFCFSCDTLSGSPTHSDVSKAINWAKRLLFRIDQAIGIDVGRGRWE